jgi:hypothetical protein
MATLRTQLVAAACATLGASGKPDGLRVVSRSARPAETDDLPRISVSRIHEDVQKAYPNMLRSPLSDRHLRIRLDIWVGGDEPENTLEPLLAWATSVMLADPTWGKLALDTMEDSTDWDTDQADEPIGHAWMEFTIRYSTTTANQEVKQ